MLTDAISKGLYCWRCTNIQTSRWRHSISGRRLGLLVNISLFCLLSLTCLLAPRCISCLSPNPSQKRSLILITCKAISFLWFFFSPLSRSSIYWFFCWLLYYSSRMIGFSSHCCYITAPLFELIAVNFIYFYNCLFRISYTKIIIHLFNLFIKCCVTSSPHVGRDKFL
jgi:hypothetical protein